MLLAQAGAELQKAVGVGQGINSGNIPLFSNITSAPPPVSGAARTASKKKLENRRKSQNQADIQKLAQLWLATPSKKSGFSGKSKNLEANEDFYMIKPSNIMQHKRKKQSSGHLSHLRVGSEESVDHVAMPSRDINDIINHVNDTEISLPEYSAVVSTIDEEREDEPAMSPVSDYGKNGSVVLQVADHSEVSDS